MQSRDTTVLVFDTETTGTDPQNDQIIELTVQHGLDGAASATTWRFRPDRPIAAGAQRVHGISMEDLADAPRFADKADEVAALLDSAGVWVGYNLRFDLDIVQAELQRARKAPLSLDGRVLVDPYRLWQRMEPRSLMDAHKRFAGGEFDGAHGAAADVAATGRVLAGMVESFGLAGKSWNEVAIIAEPERLRWIGPTNHLQWDDDGQIVFGFSKNRGKALVEMKRDHDGRGFIDWMLRSDFPAHVKMVLTALSRANNLDDWREGVISRFGAPPAPAAEAAESAEG